MIPKKTSHATPKVFVEKYLLKYVESFNLRLLALRCFYKVTQAKSFFTPRLAEAPAFLQQNKPSD
jgi:hypothetical protein